MLNHLRRPAEEPLRRLRSTLESLEEGPVPQEERDRLIPLLYHAWTHLDGYGERDSWVLHAPTGMEWRPPVLTFSVVSTRGPKRLPSRPLTTQTWRIDVERGRRDARPRERTKRLVPPDSFEAAPIAEGLARMLEAGQTDARIQWSKGGRPRIRFDAVLPPAPYSRLHPWRRALYRILEERLAPRGWSWGAGGWWSRPDELPRRSPTLDQYVARLAQEVIWGQDSPRLDWTGPGRRGFALVEERVRRDLAGRVGDAHRRGILSLLEARLAPRGWVHDGQGRLIQGRHADLTRHPTLHVCGTCGELARVDRERVRRDPCGRCVAPGTGDPWDPYVRLCRCCGEVVLDRQARDPVWFCHACEGWVRNLNRRHRRCVIPRRWGDGTQLPQKPGPVDHWLWQEQRSHLRQVEARLSVWAMEVVRARLAERFPERPRWIPIGKWDRRVAVARDSRRRFEEMFAWIRNNPVGEDIILSLEDAFHPRL